MPDNYDVVIVGAGASGAAAAWNLSRQFKNIVCLEQGPWIKPSDYPSTKENLEYHKNREYSPFPNQRNLASDYPINDKESTMIWSIDDDVSYKFLAMSDEEFTSEVVNKFGEQIGELNMISKRQNFPLHHLSAKTFAKKGISNHD